MGIRYSNFSDDIRNDQLRPKMIDPQAAEHLECPEANPNNFYEIYYEGKRIELIKKCCKNFCVFCIFNLIKTDNLDLNIKLFLNSFKIKRLYIIYIVKSLECPLVGQLKGESYDVNAVILTTNQYRLLLGFLDEDKSILRISESIEDDWKPESFKEIVDFSVLEWPRERMASIIESQIKRREIKKG
jgi:hypothetical protein